MESSGVAAWEQRWHPLREEWVIVAAHRQNRPWQGERAVMSEARPPAYVETCYFCPGNVRVSGARNPDYQSVYVFDNDHPCVGLDAPRQLAPPPGIYRNAPATGIARVVCYTPKHNTTLAELPADEVAALARRLARAVPRARLAARHPARADLREQGRSGRRVESASARADLRDQLRLQDHRDRSRGQPALSTRSTAACSFRTSSAPSWRRPPHAVRERVRRGVPPVFRPLCLRVLRRAEGDARQPRDDVGRASVATWRSALKSLLVRYDNLWQMSFPYVLTLHQAPTDGGDYSGFHFHIECHPPLRKPHLLKYLAGPGDRRRQLPERHAGPRRRRRSCSRVPDVHYGAWPHA